MVYHLTLAIEDADKNVQMLQFCSESFHDVLDYLNYLNVAYSGCQIVAFSCIRKCVKEV